MNKELMLKFTALAVATTISSALVVTSASQVKAASISDAYVVSSGENKNYDNMKVINNDIIEIDGVRYSISGIANSIKNDINRSSNPGSNIQPNSVPTQTIKFAYKWIVSHWTTIYNKLPARLQKYFKIDFFTSVADQFIGISDSVEDFLHRTFRAMGMPETANWAITNIILLLLPI